MIRIGLTGGIGSGKSAVADLLAERGAVIIDADLLAREAVAPGSEGLARVVAEFGPDVLHPDGSLDRARLGGIVFADAAARARLNAIVHPRVRELARLAEAAAEPDAVVVHVIPLLVETGQSAGFDLVVVVDVDPAVQLHRVMRRDGLDEAAAAARIAAQASREQRLAAADLVIDNSGSVAELAGRVDALWRRLHAADQG
ncbi:MAG: dephospho-CoA kinase [Propionicimonas sp.]